MSGWAFSHPPSSAATVRAHTARCQQAPLACAVYVHSKNPSNAAIPFKALSGVAELSLGRRRLNIYWCWRKARGWRQKGRLCRFWVDEQSQAGELDETATTQGETLKLCLHSSSLASRSLNPPRCRSSHSLPPFLCFSPLHDLLSTAKKERKKKGFQDSKSPSKDSKMRMRCVVSATDYSKKSILHDNSVNVCHSEDLWLFPHNF